MFVMNRILFLLIFLVLASGAHPQVFRGLSVKDGLPDMVVNAICKDSAGYVWFGTSSSVERFDGIRFKHYAIPLDDGKEKEVNAIVGMPGGGVWFGNNAGLWRTDGDEIPERLAGAVIRAKVYALLFDGGENLYAGSDRGVFVCRPDGSEAEQVLFEPNVLSPANDVKGLAMGDGCLWAATSRGLHSLSLADGKVRSWLPSGKGIPVSYNNIYRWKNFLYLGTSGKGVVRFDMETGEFGLFADLGYVTSLSGRDSILHVGSNGGGVFFVSAASGKTIRSIQHDPSVQDGLRSNSVYSLLVDREGIVWVGLFQLGVDYSLFQRGLFSAYHAGNGMRMESLAIRSIEIGKNEKLVGTRDGLFYIDESRGIFRRFGSPELRSSMIMCTYAFGGKYYIGTFGGGMYVLDPLSVELSRFGAGLAETFASGIVHSIASDRSGNLWIGTSDGLFCYGSGKLLAHYTSRNSKLPSDDVYRIYFDSRDRGWICADNSVLLMGAPPERLLTDKFPEGFVADRLIRDICEDSEHNLYFLPDKGHLFVSDLSLSHFREIAGTPLDGKTLQFAIEDDARRLWIGTSDGLFRYDKEKNIESYNFSDGLLTSIFLNCLPKRDAEGRLWFGSSRGMYYTDILRADSLKKYFYPLRITESYVSRAVCRFRFSDFSYTSPRYMAYEYCLDGDLDGWKRVEGTSEASFYGLSPGRHEFRLRHPGEPESEICFPFSVPWALSDFWWMAVLAAAAIAAFAFFKKKRKAAEVSVAAEEANETPTVPDDKYKSLNLSNAECLDLAVRLDTAMREKKLYLDPKLKVANLAEALDVPSYKMSYLFSQHLKMTFYDYVNGFRIAEFKSMVAQGEYKNYTLNALIEKCGFLSRASFFRYFKKETEMTPNEYIGRYGSKR